MFMTPRINRLTFSAVMLGLAAALTLLCSLIPFLHLPFGGGFTVAAMLPIILVSYRYGVRQGLGTAFCYALLQLVFDLMMGQSSVLLALFLPNSEQSLPAALCICLLDYLVAYTVLGLGGAFRRIRRPAAALCLGTVLALGLRYLAHILSGYLFYGAYADWFFRQEGFYRIGTWILDRLSGRVLALVYSVFYNGLYMIPELILTTVAAACVSRLPSLREKLD